MTNYVRNFCGHLHTINTHRRLVRQHCFKAGIPVQGLLHDLSKYHPVEFLAGVKYYVGDHSPNVEERRNTPAFSEAIPDGMAVRPDVGFQIKTNHIRISHRF